MIDSTTLLQTKMRFCRERDSVLDELFVCECHMRGALQTAGFSLVQLPHSFARQSGRGGLELRSYCSEHPLGAQARCAMIHSAKCEIINLMIFTRAPFSCPVYASELILFNKKMHVAVVDLQFPDPTLQGRLAASIAEPAHRYRKLLSDGGELPEWALEHFTPWCVYNRAQTPDETPKVCDAFIEYLDIWIEDWLPNLIGQDEDLNDLHCYQMHHIINTPGRKFLSRGFSPQWAEDYLSRFMYAPMSIKFGLQAEDLEYHL